ncbi:hypothetical protein TNCV_2316111 [Trichonephila clavipes]|nr:hypothetical protein TNCV_2316111 [Trichonephila clavipes]
MDPLNSCPSKDLVLPNLNIEQISSNTRFLIISLPSNEVSSISPFVIQKALIGIGEAHKLIVLQLSQTFAQAAKSSILNNSTQTDENITKIKCPPLKLLAPLSSKQRPNISTANTTSSSAQAQLLPSISSKTSITSDPQPPTPMSEAKEKIKEQPSQDAKKIAKARSRKRRKELLKKMKEAIIEIKMNPHRPRKPASDEYTTNVEEMIVYDVEDEIETNPDYVKKKGKTYCKGQLLLTPTRHRK